MRSSSSIYVLDDDLDFLEVMKSYFNKMDLSFQLFSDADEFLSKVQSAPPRLSLIDLHLKGLERGFEIVKSIRNLGENHAIMVVSGKNSPEAVTHALECGANDFLFKPLDRQILNTKVSNFIGSEQLDNWLSREIEIPDRGIRATVYLDGTVIGIDELGLEFESKHYMPNGTQIKVQGEFLKSLFPERESLILILSESSMDIEKNHYLCYGEFYELKEHEISSIRNWILKAQ